MVMVTRTIHGLERTYPKATLITQVSDVVTCHATTHVTRKGNEQAGNGIHMQRPHAGND